MGCVHWGVQRVSARACLPGLLGESRRDYSSTRADDPVKYMLATRKSKLIIIDHQVSNLIMKREAVQGILRCSAREGISGSLLG